MATPPSIATLSGSKRTRAPDVAPCDDAKLSQAQKRPRPGIGQRQMKSEQKNRDLKWGVNTWYKYRNRKDLQEDELKEWKRMCTIWGSPNITEWDVSGVTDMSYLFAGKNGIQHLDLTKWDVFFVESFEGMFKNSDFGGKGLYEWQPDAAITFEMMFENAVKFDANLKKWEDWIRSALNYSRMFKGAKAFRGEGLLYWFWCNPSATNTEGMLMDCVLFNENLFLWEMGNVTDMRRMFQGSTKFDGKHLDKWEIHQDAKMTNMFKDCPKIKSDTLGDGDNWPEDRTILGLKNSQPTIKTIETASIYTT